MFTVSRFAPPFFLLPLLQACSDYSFSEPAGAKDSAGDREGRDPEVGADTAAPSDDTADLDDDTDLDTEACYAPEFGYEQNPAARLITDDDSTPVTLTYVHSDTAYNDLVFRVEGQLRQVN